MSVQNLRNKFSQNSGTVPYNPPGLSYGKPVAPLPNGNYNNSYNHSPNGGFNRFKTIREEPDVAQPDEKPAATKNNSFLRSYVANEMTRSPAAAVNGAYVPAAVPTKYALARPSEMVTPKKLVTAVKAPAPPVTMEAVTPLKSPANPPSKFVTPVKPAPLVTTEAVAAPKSPAANPPTRFVTPIKPAPSVLAKFSVKSPAAEPSSPPPPPLPKFSAKPPAPAPVADPSPPAKFCAKATSPVLNSGYNGVTAVGGDRWKTKFDETETKRKTLLSQSQKLLREKSDMERQMSKLRADLESSNGELSERTLQLSQLRKLSEEMYKEYVKLKNKYELETDTLEKAMERAQQWYKQNRELKRRSSALMQKVMSVAPSTLDDLADDTDGNDNDAEMDELRKTVKGLTQEVSRLQAELNAIKLQEYEAQEQIADLSSELEKEHRARERSEQELKELKMKHDNLENVSRKVVEETTVLHQRYKKEKEHGEKIQNDANKVKSERDVLARQSQLLMMDAASDEKIMKLLFEVEQLQRTLSQERQEHADQLKDLQEKLESQSESEQIELYEEKLKLTEAELLCSQQRTEIAESQLEEIRKKLEETKMVVAPPCAPPPPPPPPPPMSLPPPPPMPMMSTPNLRTVKLKTVSTLNHSNGDSNAIEDIENYLGLQPANAGPQAQNGAIDAIINQIKGGRFSLKSTDKEKQVTAKKQEPPPVVNEMMNVLGTLRRNPKRRASFKQAPADVAL